MIDPFSIITILSSYATGAKVTSLIANWSYGKNLKHLQNGTEYFTKGYEQKDFDFLKKSIAEFDCINEEEDKQFALAIAHLYRAVCYTYLLQFSMAYYFLEKLESIEVGKFTIKKNLVEETKNEGRAFKEQVVAFEKKIKELPDDEQDHTHSKGKFSIGALVILILVILLIIVTARNI